MNKICAVIDAQGFMFNGEFIPREIAIVGDTIDKSVQIDTKLDYRRMSHKDVKTNKCIEEMLQMTLRPLDDQHESISNVKEIICGMYEASLSPMKYVLGVKNNQLASLLSSYFIPWVNLDELNCPPVTEFFTEDEYGKHFCLNHKRSSFEYKCAHRKCFNIWNWLIKIRYDTECVELNIYED